MSQSVVICNKDQSEKLVETRPGETKLGQKVAFPEKGDDLEKLGHYYQQGIRFLILGIPESIGIRANLGRCCAEGAWGAFLKKFLNMQSNRFLTGKTVLCFGHIDTQPLNEEAENIDDNRPDAADRLRNLCARLDDLVYPVIETVVKSKIIPIVIGGGHNNSYPLLKGTSLALNAEHGINCINCDPHADYRPTEGRHSGNSFSYAHSGQYLAKYYVFGLHEAYNSSSMLDLLDQNPKVDYSRFEAFEDFELQLEKAAAFFKNSALPIGMDIDLDCMVHMPVSAASPSGWKVEEMRKFVRKLTPILQPAYFHLPEGAPSSPTEDIMVGKTLAYLVSDFIKARSL